VIVAGAGGFGPGGNTQSGAAARSITILPPSGGS